MSYVIIPSNVANTNTQTPFGISLLYSAPGTFQTAYTYEEQARNNFKNLLLTYPGERTGDWIKFGCNLKEIIFEPNIDEIKPDIVDLIQSAVSTWLPYINIQNIDIKTAEDDPSLIYLITISIQFTVSTSLLGQTITLNTSNTGNITIE
jgi:phage baseplate assembly protein W